MDLLQKTIILITLAAVLYTIGLILCLIKKYPPSFWFFLTGLSFDCWGTWQMFQIADKITFNIHAALGISALILMMTTVILGATTLFYFQKKLANWFRSMAIIAYTVWLLSFVAGAIAH